MWAYREAAGPGNFLAPKEFLAQLRRDTGIPALTCWWEPSVPRDVIIGNQKQTRWGAWVVYMKCRVVTPMEYRGHNIHVAHDQWVDVYKLDGEYGCPTVLGTWVAACLNQADQTKRGFDRVRELNELNERSFIQPLIDNRVENEEFFKDKFTKRIFQNYANNVGMPTRIKEDVDREFKRLEREQKEMWEDIHREAKTYRFYREGVA